MFEWKSKAFLSSFWVRKLLKIRTWMKRKTNIEDVCYHHSQTLSLLMLWHECVGVRKTWKMTVISLPLHAARSINVCCACMRGCTAGEMHGTCESISLLQSVIYSFKRVTTEYGRWFWIVRMAQIEKNEWMNEWNLLYVHIKTCEPRCILNILFTSLGCQPIVSVRNSCIALYVVIEMCKRILIKFKFQ